MKFSLWGGDIYGTNTDVTDSKLLFQDWYGGEWDKPSKVSFTLTKINKGTRITLHHTDIPDKEFDDIADGWKRYYLGPLKQFLEK